MDVACQTILVDFILEFSSHRSFAHQYEVAVLQFSVRYPRYLNKHFRPLFRRETPDKPYKGGLWRDLYQGMKVIGSGGWTEDLCIDSIRNKTHFCARHAQGQSMKVSGFCNHADMSIHQLMHFKITHAQVASVNGGYGRRVGQPAQDTCERVCVGEVCMDDVD